MLQRRKAKGRIRLVIDLSENWERLYERGEDRMPRLGFIVALPYKLHGAAESLHSLDFDAGGVQGHADDSGATLAGEKLRGWGEIGQAASKQVAGARRKVRISKPGW